MRHFRIRALLFVGLCLFGGSIACQAEALRNWPIFALGEHDAAVRALQALLTAHGDKVAEDGYFGRATQKALRRFQRAQQLVAGGETNAPTWEALLVRLHQGSKGPSVRAAQIELRAAGYAVIPDGVFDAHMASVVRRYQKQTGHTADGVIGRNTWYELLGGGEAEGD